MDLLFIKVNSFAALYAVLKSAAQYHKGAQGMGLKRRRVEKQC